ncbi:hypothetical protein [Microvirga tunisiensis]|uniref:Uncharacterized protein n=1 Tax=Microvirga tunisiensis TaxID=2108360 RepID=A0A5N7MW10_9HYPH|nr:hypothetical protein [Microvirga tunisiensis]MPR13300.1 hypothetical protein [Microvirga tunisiensis]MPR31167.1 hypothetical protein [Microvirga tunisiensis]
MRYRTRGWIMPEADVLAMLRLIDERIRSSQIEVRHRDVLIRLRAILENDLNGHRIGKPSTPRPDDQEKAA